MLPINHLNTICNYSKAIESIRATIASPNLTLTKYRELHAQLDKFFLELQTFQTAHKKSDYFVEKHVEELKNNLKSLYHQVDTVFYQSQLSLIETLKNEVEDTLFDGNSFELAQKIDVLKSQIFLVFEHYCPSFLERRGIVKARFSIEKAEAYLLGKIGSQFKLTNKELKKAEEFLEEMVEALGDENLNHVSTIWEELSPYQKKIVTYYLHSADPLLDFFHNIKRSTYQHATLCG